MSVDRSIDKAVFSFAMEGYQIDEQTKIWGRMLLEEKITMEEYIQLCKERVGVTD